MKVKKVKKVFFSLFLLFFYCSQPSDTGIENPVSHSAITNALGNLDLPPFVANFVEEALGHTGSGFCDKNKAINGIRGGGWTSGSSDVFSLDNLNGTTCGGNSTHIILSWSGKKVKNGPGADFIVFENAFYINNNPSHRFMDLVIVEVSNDKQNWCGFNPDYTYSLETSYSTNPIYWQRFAGKTPVNYHMEDGTRNFTLAQLFQDNNNDKEGDLGGGDFFDLDELSDNNFWNTGCTSALRDSLKQNGFLYLRLTPANRRINPDTNDYFVQDGMSNGPDIDGIVARYLEEF